MSVKRDDVVVVISGDCKGQVGKVLTVDKTKGVVVVEGVNVRKRHKKADRQGKSGGIIEFAAAIHISNVRAQSAN